MDLSLLLLPSAKRGENGEKEARRGAVVIVIIASTFSPFPSVKITLCVSVLSVSNECNDLNADAMAFGKTRSTER